MHVKFLDVGKTYTSIRAELDAAMQRVLESGWYILGPEVEAFEADFAQYVGAKHCVGVGNGLQALTLALYAAGVRRGDEVIVPSNTYIATWLAVTHLGATVAPVEPDVRTFNITAQGVERAWTKKTRAILPVHLYGQPALMDPLIELARERGVFLLDDAAQAHGSRCGGRRIGSLGDATAWSFYPGKNLGAFGDGGAITTDDPQLAHDLRVLRNYGSQKKYENERLGFNSRLDPLQAAVLRVKLRHLDDWNAHRARLATRYLERLEPLAHTLSLPYVDPGVDSVWHLFVVRPSEREALQRHLAASDVQTLIHYPIPPHKQQAYARSPVAQHDLPVSERMHAHVLSLPMGPHMSLEEVDHVCHAIHTYYSDV